MTRKACFPCKCKNKTIQASKRWLLIAKTFGKRINTEMFGVRVVCYRWLGNYYLESVEI